MTATHAPAYQVSARSLGYNRPQQMGRRLWAPMFAMTLMAWVVGFALSIGRATIISDSGVTDAGAARLAHLVPAFQFLGFLAIFSAVSFAIAVILGTFRRGGGEIQESVGTQVGDRNDDHLVAVVLHFGAAANVGTWSAESLARWAEVLEGFRRLGVAMYLFGTTFGLGTIITVLRFQSSRVRQLAAEVHG